MVTGISLLVFIAFYLLYGTSKKMAAMGNLGVETWLGEHANASKYSGLVLLIISLALSCFYWGLGPGVFSFFINRFTQYIHNTAERFCTNRHSNRCTGIGDG